MTLQEKLLQITGFVVFFIICILVYKRQQKKENLQNSTIKEDELEMDTPINFGFKNQWFAIKTKDPLKLIDILNLKDLKKSNWKLGIEKAYKDSVFITPSINEWTLVCGWGLPISDSIDDMKVIKDILKSLSFEFEEAQYFCTHRVTEYHCWVMAKNGEIKRVYNYLGESGQNIEIEGQPTEIEMKLNLLNTIKNKSFLNENFLESDIDYPNENLVMEIAENWSVNPTELEKYTINDNFGIIGKIKKGST